MRRCVERDRVKFVDMADLVLALRASVLTGHDIALEIDGDVLWPVYAAFLAEG